MTALNDIITYLEAFASGVGRQPVENSYSFYAIAHNQLKTQEEREALKYGVLAVCADVGKMRLRRWYYTYRFKKAIEQLT